MKRVISRTGVIVAMFLAAATHALAHHSVAAFDMKADGRITGRVERVEWSNPHAYIYLMVRGANGKEARWRIEAGSPSVMRAKGWTADSLKIGDVATVDYKPSRDPAKREGLVAGVRVGSRQLAGLFSQPQSSASSQPLPVASGLAGIWVPVPTPGPQQKLRQQPGSLPLTDAARKALAAFREASTSNPAVNCEAPTAPVLMIVPEIKQIEIAADKVTIRSQGFIADRVVHLGDAQPARPSPTRQGYSRGRWEGSRLVVETGNFLPNRVGNAIGVPSGKGKRLVESFELNDSRTQILYRFTLTDPEFLTQPVTEEQPWSYRPDLSYSQDPCDLQSARRYLK